MEQDFKKILRESYAGDRRANKRYEVDIPGKVVSGGHSLGGQVINVSKKGLAIKGEGFDDLRSGDGAQITFSGVNGSIEGKIDSVFEGVCRVIVTSDSSVGLLQGFLKEKFGDTGEDHAVTVANDTQEEKPDSEEGKVA